MRSLTVAVLAAAALSALAAAPAGANTLNYNNRTLATTDPSPPFVLFDQNGPTGCSSSVLPTVGSAPTSHIKRYAFRNLDTSSDCTTVAITNPNCPSQSTFSFTTTLSNTSQLVAGDALSACSVDADYSFFAPAGQTFITSVFGAATTPFSLGIGALDIAPVHAVSAPGVALPGGNTLSVTASSLEDGTGVQGTLTDDAGTGHHYGGPVRCLRVSGYDASLVMTFDSTTQGLASKWKGAVYWLHQDPSDTSDGQRNSLLTQAQLDGRYASCPDPTKPVTGSFRNTGVAQQILVVDNGAQG